MADAKAKLTMHWELVLTLSEDEAQALDAIVGYGADSFLEVFYKHMGKAYLEPYERGFRSLVKAINEQLGPQIYDLKEQRKAMARALKDAERDRLSARLNREAELARKS